MSHRVERCACQNASRMRMRMVMVLFGTGRCCTDSWSSSPELLVFPLLRLFLISVVNLCRCRCVCACVRSHAYMRARTHSLFDCRSSWCGLEELTGRVRYSVTSCSAALMCNTSRLAPGRSACSEYSHCSRATEFGYFKICFWHLDHNLESDWKLWLIA